MVLPAALDERGTEQREAAAAVGAQPGERGMFPRYHPLFPSYHPYGVQPGERGGRCALRRLE